MSTATLAAASSAMGARIVPFRQTATAGERRTVTYIFQCNTAAAVNIAYVPIINGQPLPSKEAGISRVRSGVSTAPGGRKIHTQGKIEVRAKTGDTVALYLNSDAVAGRRKHPVFAVVVGVLDVVVRVEEKEGQLSDDDTPTRVTPTQATAQSAPTENYTALLTGGVWMKVSHRFSADEVTPLVPPDTPPEVITALRRIYDVLPSATLVVARAGKGDAAPRSLRVNFNDADNPRKNIRAFNFLRDGLTRVHPAGYAALLMAALDNNIPSLRLSSCWRPMLGSIAHREGRGLDVLYVGETLMNRQELRNAFVGKSPRRVGNGNDRDNVTDAEVVAFGRYEEATRKLTALKRIKPKNPTSAIKPHVAPFNKPSRELTDVEVAERVEADAFEAWTAARVLGEPTSVRDFRTSLLRSRLVEQLYDPWFLDSNTRDDVDPKPNLQRGSAFSNDRLHAHHLHITAASP